MERSTVIRIPLGDRGSPTTYPFRGFRTDEQVNSIVNTSTRVHGGMAWCTDASTPTRRRMHANRRNKKEKVEWKTIQAHAVDDPVEIAGERDRNHAKDMVLATTVTLL